MFHVTPHAADRFAERVRPGMSAGAAQAELHRLLTAFGEQVEWNGREHATATECWEISPGVWVPCLIDQQGRTVAVTVLTNATMSEETRRERNARRARRTAKRKQSRITDYERGMLDRKKERAS